MYGDLLRHAERRLGPAYSRDVSEDVTQEAFVRVLEQNGAHRPPERLTKAGSIVNGLIANLRRKRERQANIRATLGTGMHSLEPVHELHLEIREVVNRVKARSKPNTMASAVMDLMVAGIVGLEEQADTLNVSIRQVRNARKRIAFRARKSAS